MEKWTKTIAIASIGVISAGAVWLSIRRYHRGRKKKQTEIHRFPRADDIEGERSKHYKKLDVDRSRVHVVCSDEDWEEVYPELSSDIAVFKALGFDCEWANIHERLARPVSLLQLATPSGRCVLVRLHLFDKVPQSLRSLLSDKGILKVGVACYDDAQKLHTDHGLCVRGCVDLRYIAFRSRSFNIGVTGLKGMAEKVLNVTLNKSFHLRCSNWEAEDLTEPQIIYAAGDALVGIQIFNKLIESKPSRDSAESLSDLEIWRKALSACQGIVDVNFSSKGMGKNTDKEKRVNCSANSSKKVEKSVSRGYSARKKPLYHNCQLYAPDGQLLCTCDVKKALWYVDKGLGVKISDNPLTVKLKFEPAGRPATERNYYLQEKENICVVCGKEDSFIRKNIVPREYRKFFPSVMKDHKSHDVVLLCTTCHQQCSVQDDALKQELALTCNAPISCGATAKFSEDKTMAKVRSAAKALITSSSKLPIERRAELEQAVRDFYGVEELDDDLLEEAAEMDTKVANNGFIPHGKKVVLHIMKHEGLIAFEKMWRQHFLDNMEPKFLPDMWSVDHSHDRLAMMEENLKRATKIITREKNFYAECDDISAQPSTSS